MRHALLLAPLALATLLPAQIGRDEWLVCAFNDYITSQTPGGIWLVDAARTTATPLTSQTPSMAAANCVAVEEGWVYYGTLQSTSVPVPNPGNVMRVLVTGGAVIMETPLNAGPIDSGSISGIVIVRDKVWYCTDAGHVGWIPKTGGVATHVITLSTAGAVGLGQSITSDGRMIYVGTSFSTSTPGPTVYEFDSESPAPTLTALASLAGSSFAMGLARDGKVLVGRISGQLWLVDPVTATAAQLNVGAPAPQTNSNGTAINPWLNIIGNVPGYGTTTRVVGFYDVATNTWPVSLNLSLAVPSGAASGAEQPFLKFGHGCVGANALEPRMGWTGLPMQGQSFTLSVRSADPGVGLMFLGTSNQTGPFGALPFSLAPLGAPGCNEYVSTDVSFVSLISGTGDGSVTIPVPVNAALAGWQLYSQWAVASTVNSFGWVVSEATHFRLR